METYWIWFSFALILIILEMLGATGFLLGISLSSAILGIILYINNDLELSLQILIFSISSIVATIAWYFLFKKTESNNNTLNNVLDKYKDKEYKVYSVTEDSIKIKIGDVLWEIEEKNNKDLKKNDLIKVIDIVNNKMIVFKV